MKSRRGVVIRKSSAGYQSHWAVRKDGELWGTFATKAEAVKYARETFGKRRTNKRKGNRSMTKAQRSARVKARGRKTRKASLAEKLLKVMNPAQKRRLKGIRIKRNRGGSITLFPIRKVATR